LLVAALLAPPTAAAAAKRKSVAVFPLVGDAARSDLARAIEASLLEQAAARGPVVAGAALARRVRNPTAAIERCAGAAPCLARLGKRARASHVLTGQAAAEGSGVRVALHLVEVAGAAKIPTTLAVATLT